MKYLDPSRQFVFRACISVRADTAELLSEMAADMGISVDELLGGLAEDAVAGLASPSSFVNEVEIPDKCSSEELRNILRESKP